MIIGNCEKCGRALREGQERFCSTNCKKMPLVAVSRCVTCREPFTPRKGQTRCSRTCVAVSRPPTEVQCALPSCPIPAVPIQTTPAEQRRGHAKYHTREKHGADCWGAAKAARVTGEEKFCEACGTSLGYRRPAQGRHQYCASCAHRIGGENASRLRPRREEHHRCSYCDGPVTRAPARGSARSERFFCSTEHRFAWQKQRAKDRARRRGRARRAETIVCRGCRKLYEPTNLPTSYDAETRTYQCHRCQSAGGQELRTCNLKGCSNDIVWYPSLPRRFCCRDHYHASRTLAAEAKGGRKKCENATCTRGVDGYPKVIVLRGWELNRRRYCSRECTLEVARRKKASTTTCEVCNEQVVLTGGRRGRFCSPGCYHVWRRMTPGHAAKSIDAAARILAAYADGVRGPKTLAAAAGSSTKTVYKVLRAEGRHIGSDVKQR